MRIHLILVFILFEVFKVFEASEVQPSLRVISGLLHISIDFNCYLSFPYTAPPPIDPPSPASMVSLLLPLLLLRDLGQTQAWGKFWQPTVRQKMVLGDQNLTSNSLTDENKAMTFSYPLPPALFRGRKTDTGKPISHSNVRP